MLAFLLPLLAPPAQIAYIFEGDLWTCDMAGAHRTRVARHAQFPCWSPDHKRLCFVRGSSVVVLNLTDRREQVIWKSKTKSEPGAPTWGPRYGPARWDAEKPIPNRGDSIVFTSGWMRQPLVQTTSQGKKTEDAEFVNLPAAVEVEAPTWSRDGEKLAIAVNGDVWVDFDEGGGWAARRIVASADYDFATGRADMEIEYARQFSWSPDGTRLAYVKRRVGGESIAELWIVNVKTARYDVTATKPERLSQRVRWVSFAPDGKTLVCQVSSEAAAGVALYDLATHRWTTIVPGGEQPTA